MGLGIKKWDMDCVMRMLKFYDKNVSTNTTVSGQIILAQNVNVNSGANLQFNITNSVTITPVFYIAKGGVFKISK